VPACPAAADRPGAPLAHRRRPYPPHPDVHVSRDHLTYNGDCAQHRNLLCARARTPHL